MESERELSTIDRLARTEKHTNSDGTVTVTIDGWHETSGGGAVIVEFITPTGSIEEERMNFPQPGEQLADSKFYKLTKSCGLSLENADLLEGEETRARVNGGRWSLEPKESFTRNIRDINLDISWTLLSGVLFYIVYLLLSVAVLVGSVLQ